MTPSTRKFFWQFGWSIRTKLPGCWQLKNKNSPSIMNYHLLFDVQTAYSSTREGVREREGEYVRVREQTQRDWTLWMQTNRLANWPLFQNLPIFIYSNSGYWWGWCHLAKLLRHLSRVQNSLFLFLQSNLSQKSYESILLTFWPSCVERYVLA